MSFLSEGTKVYEVEVWGGAFHQLERTGEIVIVGDQAMVRLAHGTILKNDGRFHATLADAKRAAADRLDEMRSALADKSFALRVEANQLEGKETLARDGRSGCT